MRKDRLLKLADFILTVPKEQFNMEYWGKDVNFKSCGTAACACGWATVLFKRCKDAPHLEEDKYSYSNIDFVYNGKIGFNAAAEFFDITHEASEYLFYPSRYKAKHPTRRMVSQRIKKFVKTGKVPCEL